MLQDVRFAFRTLLKNPAFTAAAVLCLTLGIGVNATIFSCVRALLLRPFPYREPEAIVAIGENSLKRGWHMNTVSYPNFRSWQAENRSLENIGIYTGASFNLATDGGSQYVQGANISWTMFRTLGVAPALGRDFQESEDRVGAARVVLISDRIWHDRFDGRRDVLGKSIIMNGVPHTVIGVMPVGFEFPAMAGAWTTMRQDPLDNRSNHSWQVLGRLKRGVTIEQARKDLNAVAASLEARYPESNTAWGVDIESLRDNQVGTLRPVLLIMMASVAFVLLIACANVANLLLARATARAKEMSVRVALGANGWRLVRQLLVESMLVAFAGAAFGVAFAYGFLQWVKTNIVGMPFWMKFTIDWQVLAFTAAVAVGTGLLFGIVPALQAARPNLSETLRDAGARGTSTGRARQRLRSGLVVGEVALSLVLLVGAALMIRSFLGMQGVQPGFDPSNLLTVRLTLNGPSYDSTYKRFAFYDRLLADLNGRPGIVSASITNNLPLGGSNNNSFFTVEGQPMVAGQEATLENRWVSPHYLETMKIPLRRGRMFTQQEWADSSASGRVAVINEYMAQRYWGGATNALGKRFTFDRKADSATWFTVIGVAADIKNRQLSTTRPEFQGYLPYRQGFWSTATIVVRTRADADQATRLVLGAIKQIDPLIPAYRIMTMDANIARSYWQQAFYGKVFGAFALIALLLAAVGVYGVISYAVSQRTQEIGVRVALGAQRSDVFRLIVGHGAMLGGIGVAIGLVGALAVTRFLRTFLFGVSPFDPVSFVGVAAVLTSIALLASYLPARRAARVDPVEALRYE